MKEQMSRKMATPQKRIKPFEVVNFKPENIKTKP